MNSQPLTFIDFFNKLPERVPSFLLTFRDFWFFMFVASLPPCLLPSPVTPPHVIIAGQIFGKGRLA